MQSIETRVDLPPDLLALANKYKIPEDNFAVVTELPSQDKRHGQEKKIVEETAMPRKIKSIHFGLLSPEDVGRLSEFDVVNFELYQRQSKIATPNGVLDNRLGTSDKVARCKTCHQKMQECVGHWAQINLELPVFHIGYFKAILTILQVICKNCGHILAPPVEVAKTLRKLRNPSLDTLQRARVRKVLADKAKDENWCYNCSAFNGSVRKVNCLRIIHDKFRDITKKKTSSTTTTSASTTFISSNTSNPNTSTTNLSTNHQPTIITNPSTISMSSSTTSLPTTSQPPTSTSIEESRSIETLRGEIEETQEENLLRIREEEGDFMIPMMNVENDHGKDRYASLLSLSQKEVETHFKERAKKDTLLREEWKTFLRSYRSAMEDNQELGPMMKGVVQEIDPLVALHLFKMIPDHHVEVLGMDPMIGRPELMILTKLIVPPVCIRPSIVMDAGSGSNEDDLSMKLSEIVHVNHVLQTHIEKGSEISSIMENWEYLQVQTAIYVNSELPGVPAHLMKSTKPTRGLCQRLKGKQGRFRGNLSGKRVDFSSRTVISPDPNLKLDEVAVPRQVAKILTYPEVVTRHNRRKLQRAVKNGVDKHPGANYVISHADPNNKKSLKYADCRALARDLQLGDIVERHVHDGDIVLFNRQPSLHRMSIMSHRVRVKPWRSFRFNECVCAPYNADFDGDEMNLHVPQTEEARAEALTLMSVVENLVTPRSGEPLISATQDFISTAYLVTSKDVFYDRGHFCQYASFFGDAAEHIDLPPPAILKPMQLWTGKQLASLMVKPNASGPSISFEATNKSYDNTKKAKYMDPADGYVVFQNSELLCGLLDKAILGSGSKKSLYFHLIKDVGNKEAAESMSRLSKLSARWIGERGFSIGIDDVRPSEQLRQEIDDVMAEGYDACKQLVEEYTTGRLVLSPGCTLEETLEDKMTEKLSAIRSNAGDLCIRQLSANNSAKTMAVAGSKGSNLNIAQMSACVGQQTVSGSRVPDGFLNRSLPHFKVASKDADSKGFVGHSFYQGLTPSEFFFHTMSGREGLVDTAVKTAETGYMQRRLVKALEDLGSCYDGTVRSSDNGLVQFTYGDDGLDPSLMEKDGKPVDFDHLAYRMMHEVPIGGANDLPLKPYEITSLVTSLLSQLSGDHVDRLKESVENYFQQQAQQLSQLRIRYGLPSLLNAPITQSSLYDDDDDDDDDDDSDDLANGGLDKRDAASLVNKIMCWTRPRISRFLEITEAKVKKSVIEPGTAVGAIAAQSIGEPSTQMTLKTFHFAGISSLNVTLGVPRIKEIINASKKISTPIINCYLKEKDWASANRTKLEIEKTVLAEVCTSMAARYQSSKTSVRATLDMDFIRKHGLGITQESVLERLTKASGFKERLKQANLTRGDDGATIIITPSPALPTARRSREVLKKDVNNAVSSLHYAVQNIVQTLPQVQVYGIDGIERVVISREDEKSTSDEYMLLVEGYGLLDVLGIENVDPVRTSSNHINEIENKLGIEAARTTIIQEINRTMGAYGINIDYRHIFLLSDIMSNAGTVLGITRHGISKMKSDSVLMLASFEKTTEHLFDSAIYSKEDEIRGVSECIIMGIPIPLGTGCFKLMQVEPTQPHVDDLAGASAAKRRKRKTPLFPYPTFSK